MISLCFGLDTIGSWLFFTAIILMVAAMVQFTIEIQIANSALDVHLSDLEKHQEWHDFLATSKLRGKKISQSLATAATENFGLNPSAHIRPLYF
jgi:hypothetical protein